MPKYLVIANYTPDGVKGVLDKGGTARSEAVAAAISGLGGSMESFYFGFGADDAYVTADLPDHVSAAALGLRVSATGLASARTVVLLTPAEIDQAAGVSVDYRPPGS
jgi:uncharacterized protein with GYD domain